jgi:hypothetical protein
MHQKYAKVHILYISIDKFSFATAPKWFDCLNYGIQTLRVYATFAEGEASLAVAPGLSPGSLAGFQPVVIELPY